MNTKTFKTALILLILSTVSLSLKSQIIVTSTDGYSVEISINPTSLLIYNGADCRNGYNYDINFDYSIKITGNKIPDHLYTLQGNFKTADGEAFFDIPNISAIGESSSTGRIWTKRTDCATANLRTTPFKNIQIIIQGPGIGYKIIDYTSNPLPIELIRFNAKRENSIVNLIWSTATETNNDYFTIEHSSNGIDFISVKNIKGAGNSNQLNTYTYSESDIETDGAYYRLKQTDFDGNYSYSNIVYVAPIEMEANIIVYPNPSETNQIRFNSNTPELYTLSLSTLAGQIIHSTELLSNQITLPELPKGYYLLQFKNRETGLMQSVKYIQK